MRYFILYAVIISFECITSCNFVTQKETEKDFGEMALQASTIPIRPGEPGKRPFWNGYAKRFIYAPAFNFSAVENASKYRYEILSLNDSSRYNFESDVPYAPLSPVWAKMPVSSFELKVIGISDNGDSLGLAGTGQYYRASPYDPEDSVYHKKVMDYDSSARLVLDKLMHEEYVNYWLQHQSPDPEYKLYRYANKIMSALVMGAVAHAKLTPDSTEVKRSTKLAIVVANYLLSISEPEGTPLEYFTPTYHGYDKIFARHKGTQMQHDITMVPYVSDAGYAYLDLYDLTQNEKYLTAAKNIAQTLRKLQLDNGTWYLFVNNNTGNPSSDILAIPTRIINYFNRLRSDYEVDGLDQSIKKALQWVMDNPVKTFNWHGQFEDVRPTPPYKNLSREQACKLAVYLFKNKKDIELAETLVRFSEDQFVIWEKPRDVAINDAPGYKAKNWLTPCVQEQYFWWMPVARSAGIMMDAYWQAYEATGKKLYLAKAKSIANSFTLAQKIYNGIYPTYFTQRQYPLKIWLNNMVWPAKRMMQLAHHLKTMNKNG